MFEINWVVVITLIVLFLVAIALLVFGLWYNIRSRAFLYEAKGLVEEEKKYLNQAKETFEDALRFFNEGRAFREAALKLSRGGQPRFEKLVEEEQKPTPN